MLVVAGTFAHPLPRHLLQQLARTALSPQSDLARLALGVPVLRLR
jgi:hypothetical protein